MNRIRFSRLASSLALCLGVLLIGNTPAAAITVVDTTPANTSVGPFGEPNTATYGQTITAPLVDHVLTDFTFYLNDSVNPDFIDFQAYVYAWDATNHWTVGPALYASGPLSTSNNGGAGGYEAFTISTGAVSLTPGGSYVLFFSASNLFDGQTGNGDFAARDNDPYAGGNFVFINNGSNFGQLSTTSWGQISTYDAAFKATFVPEPSTCVLAGLGLIGCLGWAARRRRGK